MGTSSRLIRLFILSISTAFDEARNDPSRLEVNRDFFNAYRDVRRCLGHCASAEAIAIKLYSQGWRYYYPCDEETDENGYAVEDEAVRFFNTYIRE